MGAAINPKLARLKWWQIYTSLFLMNDESWALTMGHYARAGQERPVNGAFLFGSGLAAFAAWNGATLAGLTLGGILARPEEWGLDFAFVAVFLGLLVGFWRGKQDIMPWATAAAVALLAALYLPGKWYILLGGLAGALVGGLRNDN
jgi:predicted branched-subunit amino acid permease